ncbi:MAG TPA: peptidase T [Fastidiosipila sp.]|nr:peptidase T [Fastidiosipila sp.]
MDLLLDRFLRYIAVETRANPDATKTPSSEGQLTLAELLADELRSLELDDVNVDQYGYVTARLPGNQGDLVPAIALIAHLDTAPDLSGLNEEVNTFVYEGGDITLQSGSVISETDIPQLKNMVGETLITTKGDTLLGADNKAGIAIVMSAVDRLRKKDDPRGDVMVVFTPDEEIGHGADLLDLEQLGARFAFTIDGGELGEFETENFNAASVKVDIQGRITHPGSAKGLMVNAGLIASEFVSMLPAGQRPELTADREGFIMLDKIDASIDEATLSLIIRDHDKTRFAEKKAVIEEAVRYLNKKHGERIRLTIEDQYQNMAEVLVDHPYIEELALEAMADEGVTPLRVPIRGGTDGARLTLRGLPCPNLFTGGYNFHSKTEFASLDQMRKAVDVVTRIILNAANKAW